MNEFLNVMKSLSDQNRLKIVKMLQHRELCVCEIQAGLGLAQPAVSKHLKVLENAGIVISRKEGLWVNYSLTRKPENQFVSSILGNLRYWLNDDPEMTLLLEKLPEIHRENICN